MIDKSFQSYLQNKSVALVGPANYLTKLSLGKVIDDYDVVVRINRGMQNFDKLKNHIGKKTNILYNCLIEHPDNGGKIDVQFLKKHKVKWICTIPTSDQHGKSVSNKLHPMVKWRTIFKVKIFFNFHVFNPKSYSTLNEKVKSRANTGFSAIFDLLEFNISKLFITGFSFYLDDFIDGYKDGCERSSKEFSLHCFNSKRHNQFNQWSFLKETVKKDNRIITDKVLSKILLMDNLDRKEFEKIVRTLP